MSDSTGPADLTLSTGVELLDRRLGGGITAGRFVLFVAPPESQSEVIVESIADARPCSFLSLHRPTREVEAHFESAGVDLENTAVHSISPTSLLEDPEEAFDDVPAEGYLILEGASPLGRADRSERNAVLSALRDRLWERNAAAIVHWDDRELDDVDRLTLSRADVVWWLQLVVTSLSIETRLIIPKVRGGRPLTEPVKLKLTETVGIDTSRDIA